MTYALTITPSTPPHTSVGFNQATISWTSDVPSTGRVEYGSMGSLSLIGESAQLSTTHSVVLSPLESQTLYYYRIVGIDEQGESVTLDNLGSNYHFTTAQQPNLNPPQVTNVKIQSVTKTTATIGWTTDVPATSKVYYGIEKANTTDTSPGYVFQHAIVLSLQEGKSYKYLVSSCSVANVCTNSTESTLVTGEDTVQPFLNVTLPPFMSQKLIDVTGTTKVNSDVKFFMGGQLRRSVRSNSNGSFMIAGIMLNEGENKLKVEATDQLGGTLAKEFAVTVDTRPPKLVIGTINDTAKTQAITVNGSVDELATITFDVINKADREAPARVKGLTNGTVYTNTIELRWDRNTEKDLREYVIYRNGMRITSTRTTNFRDTGAFVDSGSTYRYQVSAIDDSCNEGVLSESLIITTPLGGQQFNRTPNTFNLTCSIFKQAQKLTLSGDFSQSVSLGQGENYVTITAEDRAGNKVTVEKKVVFENQAPKFVEINLDELTPSYVNDIYVRGKLDKKATLYAYVNNKTSPVNVTVTHEDYSFTMHIPLERDIKFSSETGEEGESVQGLIESSDAWMNHVRIVARGTSGLEAEERKDIIYAMCGYGNWFNVVISQPTPSMLNPRLILEGLAKIGFAVNLSSTASIQNETSYGQTSTPRYKITRQPRITFQTLSQNWKNHYDTDKVTVRSMWNKDYTAGYINVNIRAYDPSYQGNEQPREGKNWTIYEKERNISMLHEDRCILQGTGCIRVPLVMELTIEEKIDENFQAAYLDMTEEGFRVNNIIQRQCWLLEIPIDKRIPPSVIPNNFLKTSVQVLEKAVELIDKVLKPLATVQKYTLYACLFGWLFQFVLAFQESWNCEYSNILQMFTGGVFKKDVAATGQCNVVYPADNEGSKQKNEACLACQGAIETRQKFEKLSHWVCDRMFCPSAPTFQKYIKDNQRNKRNTDVNLGGGNGAIIKAGSDCAEVPTDDYNEIIKQYNYYQQNGKGNAAGGSGTVAGTVAGEANAETDVDCSKLHERNEKCCSTEYMNTWNSACVIMNELKESKCLAAEQANDRSNEGDCNKLWNAVAGFCDADGKAVPQLVNTYFRYGSESRALVSDPYSPSGRAVNTLLGNVIFYPDEAGKESAMREAEGEPREIRGKTYPCTGGHVFSYNDDRNIYYRIISAEDFAESIGGSRAAEDKLYYIHRGYIVERKDLRAIEVENAGVSDYETGSMGDSPVNSYLVFRPVQDVTDMFEMPKDDADQRTRDQLKLSLKEKFHADVIGCASDGRMINRQETDDVWERIYAKIGITDQEYIVDPTSSLLRSIQCVCLPAITSYLRLWKAILTAVKTCFNSIIQTGDGSAGICRAVLSVYICDLIWDMINCFTEKYASGLQRGGSDTMGNLFGALTSAGNSVSDSITNRYGGTTLYKTLFVEKRLIHAICLWAFTGVWDLDVEGLVEGEGFPVPVKSQGLLYPCQRRFMSFNQVSRPVPGMTTWTYHFGAGLVAGADIRWYLEMECSATPECKASEGFENGLCDCQRGTPQTTIIKGGYMKAGDVLSEQDIGDIFWTTTMPYRYNKARLTWEYKDNKDQTVKDSVECDIGQEGAPPPSICGFDVATLSYRCGFQTGTENWARIIGRPKALGDPFRIGDSLGFDVEVSQKMPDEAGCEGVSESECPYTKYLVVNVNNQNGLSIYNNYNNPEVLAFNGRETIPLTRSFPPISRTDFTTGPGTLSSTCVIEGVNNLGIVTPVQCSSTMKVQVSEELGPNGEKYLEYIAGDFVKNPNTGVQTFEPSGSVIRCRGDGKTYYCGESIITLRTSINDFGKLTASVLVGRAVTQTEQGTQQCDQNRPVAWTGTFTIYEGIQAADGTIEPNQNSVAQYLGTAQKFEYQFSAICAEPIGSTTAGGIDKRDVTPPELRTTTMYYKEGDQYKLVETKEDKYEVSRGKDYYIDIPVVDFGDTGQGVSPSGVKKVKLTVNSAGKESVVRDGIKRESPSGSTEVLYQFAFSEMTGGAAATYDLVFRAEDNNGNTRDGRPLQVVVT